MYFRERIEPGEANFIAEATAKSGVGKITRTAKQKPLLLLLLGSVVAFLFGKAGSSGQGIWCQSLAVVHTPAKARYKFWQGKLDVASIQKCCFAFRREH